MPKFRRLLTVAGLWIQGCAVFALWTRSSTWPPVLPTSALQDASFWLVYLLGYCIINAMLTSEFLRKTQLEADQIAAQQVQRTLHRGILEELPGYEVETFYKAFRDVGGDYFGSQHRALKACIARRTKQDDSLRKRRQSITYTTSRNRWTSPGLS